MTRQQAFDQVWDRFVVEGHAPGFHPDGGYAYLDSLLRFAQQYQLAIPPVRQGE